MWLIWISHETSDKKCKIKMDNIRDCYTKVIIFATIWLYFYISRHLVTYFNINLNFCWNILFFFKLLTKLTVNKQSKSDLAKDKMMRKSIRLILQLVMTNIFCDKRSSWPNYLTDKIISMEHRCWSDSWINLNRDVLSYEN